MNGSSSEARLETYASFGAFLAMEDDVVLKFTLLFVFAGLGTVLGLFSFLFW